MKKILHIISGLASGGAENALYKISKEHSKLENISISVISFSSNGIYVERLRKIGVFVYCIEVKNKNILKFIFELCRTIKKINPDVVQTWMVHADVLGGVLCKLLGYNIIFWGVRTTDYSVEKLKTRLLHKFAAFLSYFIPKKIICVAEAAKNSHALSGFSKNKMTVINNGFNFEEIDLLRGGGKLIRSKINLRDGDVLVGCVGRFNYAKDQINFLNAAEILCRNFNNCVFIVIGREVTNGVLMHYAENLKICENLILVDEVDNVVDYMDAMDIFVLSSRAEGFPNVVGEAMALSLPCVVTDVGDAGVMIGDDNYIVPKENADELASAINRMLELSPREKYLQGQKMRDRVFLKYSISSVANEYLSVYNINLTS